MGEVRSYTVNGQLEPFCQSEETGEIRVSVEIIMPGKGRRTKVVVQDVNLFMAKDEPWLKDLIDVMLDQTGTYVRRHWNREVAPKLGEHR